jgi:hypothetical protein
MTLGLFDLGFLGGLGAVAALDPDAQAYITAVEAADGQALETAVRAAINDFVVGCKADGIWAAIKASCVLAGARTLNGALVPLVGAAPTNFNFVAGDYNRKTGLVGNGSTKYLDSNRADNADPQNNAHRSVFIGVGIAVGSFMFADNSNRLIASNQAFTGLRSTLQTLPISVGIGNPLSGFYAASRSTSSGFTARARSASHTFTAASAAPSSTTLKVNFYVASPCRISFYSIGESLDLALLDARVTTLINTFAAVIP